MASLYDKIKNNNSFAYLQQEMNFATRRTRDLSHVHFQITPLCNLKCKMCYARMDVNEVCALNKHIMSFDEWKYFFDSVYEMGCFNITFTGGECTIHPEFIKMYSYAYDKGFDIAIMTNGTNVSEELLNVWKNRPPKAISMTLYGASAETYEKLCGNRDAYFKAYENIEKFITNKFVLMLKYTVVKDNYHDLEFVRMYCERKQLPLAVTSLLLQFNQCDMRKIEQEHIEDTDIQRTVIKEGTKSYFVRNIEKEKVFNVFYSKINEVLNKRNKKQRGIPCSAGINVCHISWDGKMTPCVSFNAFSRDPRETDFRRCWDALRDWADRVPRLKECSACVHQLRCPSCLSFHYNDTHEFGVPSRRLCWKHNHPEEAAEIEEELKNRGIIAEKELMNNE